MISQFVKHSEVTYVRNHSARMHEEVYTFSLILLLLGWHTYVFDIGVLAYYGAFVQAYYGHRGIQIYRYGRSTVLHLNIRLSRASAIQLHQHVSGIVGILSNHDW